MFSLALLLTLMFPRFCFTSFVIKPAMFAPEETLVSHYHTRLPVIKPNSTFLLVIKLEVVAVDR